MTFLKYPPHGPYLLVAFSCHPLLRKVSGFLRQVQKLFLPVQKLSKRGWDISYAFIKCFLTHGGSRPSPGQAAGLPDICARTSGATDTAWLSQEMWLVVLASREGDSDPSLLSLPNCGVAARESPSFLTIFRTRSKISPRTARLGTVVYRTRVPLFSGRWPSAE